jgi:ribosomal protein S18 acetylase RimI-like enzyme
MRENERRSRVKTTLENRLEEPRRQIRPFRDEDEAATAAVWHRAGLAAYPYLPTWQALTLAHACRVFHDVILVNCAIWVGTRGVQIVAYLAMNGSYLDRLYVDPSEWRRGWGTGFIALAKTLSPQGLELHTHQQNNAARALYEKHGFTAVKFGISPPPESAPDVEYHWRPSET